VDAADPAQAMGKQDHSMLQVALAPSVVASRVLNNALRRFS